MRHPPDLFGSSPRGACSSVALPGDNSSREGSLCCSSRHKKPNGELTGDVATSRQLHLRLCGRRCCSHTDESCRRSHLGDACHHTKLGEICVPHQVCDLGHAQTSHLGEAAGHLRDAPPPQPWLDLDGLPWQPPWSGTLARRALQVALRVGPHQEPTLPPSSSSCDASSLVVGAAASADGAGAGAASAGTRRGLLP